MAKLVDAGDSKSPAARRVGSSPTLGTTRHHATQNNRTAQPCGFLFSPSPCAIPSKPAQALRIAPLPTPMPEKTRGSSRPASHRALADATHRSDSLAAASKDVWIKGAARQTKNPSPCAILIAETGIATECRPCPPMIPAAQATQDPHALNRPSSPSHWRTTRHARAIGKEGYATAGACPQCGSGPVSSPGASSCHLLKASRINAISA